MQTSDTTFGVTPADKSESGREELWMTSSRDMTFATRTIPAGTRIVLTKAQWDSLFDMIEAGDIPTPGNVQ